MASLFHRRCSEGKSYWGPGDTYTFLVTGEESNNAYFSMLAIVPPKGGPPPHIHLHEDETFYVLEGTPTFRLGENRLVAGPGEAGVSASFGTRVVTATITVPFTGASDAGRFRTGSTGFVDDLVKRGRRRAIT